MISRRELANAVRVLAMDAVQEAHSGHPGMPMGMADIIEVLWNDFYRHHPGNPHWFNRDRFILSNGHGSMLQYAALHLSGYDLPLGELKRFRQMHAKTPGHPEVHETPGVETTTGPLGQGIANGVGFALAEKLLAARFNRPGFAIVDHHTWVFCGDGCLMEGVSQEAISLAGTWKLGKLTLVYDDNSISIDGDVNGWFTDDSAMRFRACGWHVITDVDGHDAGQIKAALLAARAETNRPSVLLCKTIIGFGSPASEGTAACHGAPLGENEIGAVRDRLDWCWSPFEVPVQIYAGWDARQAGARHEAEWNTLLADYTKAYPALAGEFKRRLAAELPADWPEKSQAFVARMQAEGLDVASRKASQMTLDAFAPLLPELIGGSADLTGSNLSFWYGSVGMTEASVDANYIHYGVREFGMTAIGNGLALHGGFLPYDATFLVFSDYARNAVRMSALIPAHSIHVYTHDSIGLGEDGPTHQPVEQLASLRLIPNNQVWRPCDAVESAVAWKAAIERREGPSCLVFSRQTLLHQARNTQQLTDIARGAYVLLEPGDNHFDVILLATGSEVHLAMDAARVLAQQAIAVRVVSMPCSEIFDAQPLEYREGVLPSWCRMRVAVEAGSADFWRKYVGLDGAVLGMHRFGASAPAARLFEYFGFTVSHLVETVKGLV